MGRNKKYTTKRELKIAERKKWMKYYIKNKEQRKMDALERYYENKNKH
jgi:hypothetical protein